MLGIERRDPRRDLGSPVAALRAVARVAEATHQLDERVRDAPHVPARGARGLGEAVARQGGRDHVERVLGATAVRPPGRVSRGMTSRNSTTEPGQPWMMSSGKRVRVLGTRVDEVDRLAVDTGAKVLELVELRLLCAPVVLARASTRPARAGSRSGSRTPSRCPRSGPGSGSAPDGVGGPPGSSRRRERGTARSPPASR